MPHGKRNPRQVPTRPCGRTFVLLACLLSGFCGSCATRPTVTRISVAALETAPTHPPHNRNRAIVSDIRQLGALYHPLNDQVGIVQVRSIDEWRRLNEFAPQHGPTPDFSRGIVVGVLSRAGTPIDGAWPASISGVRVYDSAGLIVAQVRSGCYLPNTIAFLECAYVEGLSTVLVVDIDELRYYVR